jgi:hypothetical protein
VYRVITFCLWASGGELPRRADLWGFCGPHGRPGQPRRGSGITRTARSSRRCQGQVRSAPPRCSPNGAMPGKPASTPTPSPPSPAALLSPGIRQAPGRAFPQGVQQAVLRGDHYLRRQQPTRQPLGREDLQLRPRQRQGPQPTPYASLPAPGSASSTAAGSTASPTTRLCTEPPPRSPSRRPSKSRPETDTGSVMRRRLGSGPRLMESNRRPSPYHG